jgi:nucleotide sugar dehydrogenase
MAHSRRVSVIGLGYVGLPLALLAAKKGYAVTGIDADNEKLAKLQGQLKVTSDYGPVADSKIIIVCVPTPVNDGYQPDLAIIKLAAESIAKNLAQGSLVVIESTVNPGVCDEVVIPILEKTSGLKVNEDFYVSHCPERINPGDPKWSVENIPRVAGSSSQKGLGLTRDFYEDIIGAPIKLMASLKEAEAVKVVENSFRDINIAFVNELAKSFTKLGVDVKNVIDGAATKPFAFMPHYPSVGVGGHCIPVDPYYLIEYAKDHGFDHEFLSLARRINNGMPEFTVERLTDGLNEAGLNIKGAKVVVLGLSYKANVADDRESPSYKLIDQLNKRGAVVTTYDPYISEKSSAGSLKEALKGQDAIVLATNHKEFLALKPSNLKIKVFVDGKNVIAPEDFTKHDIIYRGIGR